MKYQVGDLIHFEDDDPTFDTYDKAVKYLEGFRYSDQALGVWTGQDEDSELVAIYYQGELFTK